MEKQENISWRCEKRNVDDLKPHPSNPRVFTEKGMKDLEKSISKIGMAQPININTDGTILSGHARLMALKKKGVKEVDVYVASRPLTEKEQEEVLIRMNANIAGDWDNDKLANLFDNNDLLEWGMDIDWKDQKLEDEDTGETKEIDPQKCKVKLIFTYTDSHDIIDKFIREMKEKYPELLYEVQIDD